MWSFFVFCMKEHWYRRVRLIEVSFLFFSICALFGFVLPISKELFADISLGIVWSTTFLTLLLGSDKSFNREYQDGSLELIFLSNQPLFFIMQIRILSHALVYSGLMLFLIPIVSVMFQLPFEMLPMLLLTTIIGSWIFSYLITLVDAMLLHADQGGFLSFILLFPFSIAVVIFAIDATYAIVQHRDFSFQVSMLAIQLLVNVIVTPWLIILALSQALKNV